MEIEFQEAVDAEARMLDRVPSLKVDGARVHAEVDAGPTEILSAWTCRPQVADTATRTPNSPLDSAIAVKVVGKPSAGALARSVFTLPAGNYVTYGVFAYTETQQWGRLEAETWIQLATLAIG